MDVWWVATILSVWLASGVLVQFGGRVGRWIEARDRLALFPSWHFFRDPPDYSMRVLVRICDPFGEIGTKWADAYPPTELRAHSGVFNKRFRFDKAMLDLNDVLTTRRSGDTGKVGIYQVACRRLESLGEWSVLEAFDASSKSKDLLDGYAFQVALVQMRESDAEVAFISEPRPLRFPVGERAS
jgi:hypothetical protein